MREQGALKESLPVPESRGQQHPTNSFASMGAGKPAARHLPVNGQSIAASAVGAEPRLQPRTEAGPPETLRDMTNLIARSSSSTNSVASMCAGKPPAPHP